LLLEAGASYTPNAAQAGLERQESFFGGASLSRRVKRSSVSAFVRREVAPAFGTGLSRLELRVGLDANIPMGRAWELRMLARHIQPETPEGAERVFASGGDAFAALGRRLGRRLEISAEGRYRRRGATSASPMIQAYQAGLFVTVLTPAGRSIPTPGR
jgi:hypothetical protein